MASPLPPTGSRRNAVRFDLKGNMEMDRLQFSRIILQKELGFTPAQMDYIFALPGKKSFEVIFSASTFFEKCLRTFGQIKETRPQLANIDMISLMGSEPKAVTVLIYSEQVRMEDIKTWLGQRCTVNNAYELKDEDGIKTGGRRFFVHLKKDTSTGETHHLPPVIQLGSIRGFVFYPGQPKACRKCGSLQHLSAECNSIFCRNCGANDHLTKVCPHPMNCNLCGAGEHTFKSCPKSYANRVKSALIQRAEEPSSLGDNLIQEAMWPRKGPEEVQQQEDTEERSQEGGSHDLPPSSSPTLIDRQEEEESRTEVESLILKELDRTEQSGQKMNPLQGERQQDFIKVISTGDCGEMLDLVMTDFTQLQSDLKTDGEIGGCSAPLFPDDEELPEGQQVEDPDQRGSRKRPQPPSTDSSGGPDIEDWPSTSPNPIPYLEEQSLAVFSQLATAELEKATEAPPAEIS